MRIKVDYETSYAYAEPVRTALQLLKVTPRDDAAQRIARWRVEVDADGRLRRGDDAWGNVQHVFTLGAPTDHLRVRVWGEAEVRDTAGVLSGAPERFPPAVFLRPTPLTTTDPAIDALARGTAEAAGDEPLERLHALMAAVRGRMAFDTEATGSGTSASDAFALGRGVCQDLAHVFIAAARRLDIPARYVSGHLVRSETPEQEAGHAWAEAHVPELGWVGFDPVNGVCATEGHLRVAAGPDYLSAAPVRGARSGGGAEELTVRLTVQDVSRAPAGVA